jgi:hypothetical protein
MDIQSDPLPQDPDGAKSELDGGGSEWYTVTDSSAAENGARIVPIPSVEDVDVEKMMASLEDLAVEPVLERRTSTFAREEEHSVADEEMPAFARSMEPEDVGFSYIVSGRPIAQTLRLFSSPSWHHSKPVSRTVSLPP